jgi:dethiobiotin synthetase
MTLPSSSPSLLVVLGTGTNVGKTYVTQALVRTLNALDCPTLGLKPIESGVVPGTVSDAAQLAAASPSPGPEPLHCYALPDAVSPHLAARRAGLALDLDRVRPWASEQVARYTALRYVALESAGAVFSPLGPHQTNLDLALAFPEAQWVLVAPDCLGVLHDVTACLRAMERAARLPDYVVLSQARPADDSTGTNAAELERLGICKVAAVVGRDQPGALRAFAQGLAQRAPAGADRPAL